MADVKSAAAQSGVQIGCGSLIIIAIIVMIFSGGRDRDDLRGKLDEMDKRLERIEKKIDALPAEARQPGE